MSLLKRIGQILAKGTQIILGIQPFMQGGYGQAVGYTADILTQINQIIVDMEVLGVKWGLTGAQKLEGAVTQAISIFLRSAALAKREIANPDLFREGVTQVVEGCVKILNSLKDNDIETETVIK